MMWALYVITTFTEINDTKYTQIDSFETRYSCEIILDHFVEKYGPFQDNEEISCLQVDSD